jgi:hypothetical protein
VIVIGLEFPMAVMPVVEETEYEVIGLPPSEEGGLKVTVAILSPGTTDVMLGIPGTVAGVTGLEAADAAPWPIELIAFTVKV